MNSKRSKKKAHSFYSTKEWHRARAMALGRDNHRCTACRTSVRPKGSGLVHHIKPRRFFPELALHLPNLVTRCNRCHAAEHVDQRTDAAPAVEIGPDGFPVDSEWSKL